jgi:capsular polysaccharide biosynthesis protein
MLAKSPPENSLSEQSVNLKDLVNFFRRYTSLILACAITFSIIGGTYSLLAKKVYTAYTMILIEAKKGSWVGSPGEIASSQTSIDSGQIETQTQLLKSEQIARTVLEHLGSERVGDVLSQNSSVLPASLLELGRGKGNRSKIEDSELISALLNKIQVRRLGQSYVLEISYSSKLPQAAAHICNAVAAAFIADRLQAKIDTAENGDEIFERKVSSLREQREQAIKVVETGNFGNQSFSAADARVINPAVVPKSPSWPRPALTVALSALAGIVLSIVIAAVHRSFSQDLIDRKTIEATPGFFYLGAVPSSLYRGSRHELKRSSLAKLSEIIDDLCFEIYSNSDQEWPSKILIASAKTQREKGSICFGLALSLARLHNRILLIDSGLTELGVARMMRTFSITIEREPSAAVQALRDLRPSVSYKVAGLPLRLQSWDAASGVKSQSRPDLAVKPGHAAETADPDIDVLIYNAPDLGTFTKLARSGGRANLNVLIVDARSTSHEDLNRLSMRTMAGSKSPIGVVMIESRYS